MSFKVLFLSGWAFKIKIAFGKVKINWVQKKGKEKRLLLWGIHHFSWGNVPFTQVILLPHCSDSPDNSESLSFIFPLSPEIMHIIETNIVYTQMETKI